MHIIYNLAKHDLVHHLASNNYDKDCVCSACVRVHAYFKLLKCVSTSKCFWLVHMDPCESVRIRSLDGSIYVSVLVDD